MGDTSLSLVDASIEEIQNALSSGLVTCVELVAAYLHRISTYDCRGPSLNSIPIINPKVFDEAAASDERRANGQVLSHLDGIPFTVKDSYKVKSQTVASGSPAFQDLIANEDAFTVQKLREAGAVLIGRTNMCAMAAGGMARGVYGRAESPYNLDYLAAAFASGSSNGSGVATGASFAAFGMGEETVSSGRSPASNNALVAYTPSRGAISIRGNWPLYPTCDVVTPHTRTMDDMLALLDVITASDDIKHGDFWRDQAFIRLADPWVNRPKTFRQLATNASLKGLRIAVPSMYIGGKQIAGLPPVYTCSEVLSLYRQAKSDLEALGATIIEVEEFPVVERYEWAHSPTTNLPENCRLPPRWNATERSLLIAYAWDQFLSNNNDINLPSMKEVDHTQIWPFSWEDSPQVRFSEPTNRILYEKLQTFVEDAKLAQTGQKFDPRAALVSTPNLQSALEALESIRQTFFEDWLTENSFDLVAFPACGDVGRADADIDYESAEHAWSNGVKYSNGNRSLRHVGIPSVTVPMGNVENKGMPVGLTFLGRAGDDVNLLQRAYAYEARSRRRSPPPLTPSLGEGKDVFNFSESSQQEARKPKPELKIEKCTTTPGSPRSKAMLRINIQGFATCADSDAPEDLDLDIFVDAQPVPKEKIVVEQCHGTMYGHRVYDFRCTITTPTPPPQDDRNKVLSRRKIARDSAMVVILAKEGKRGYSSGFIQLL